jgi:hypothetical protein
VLGFQGNERDHSSVCEKEDRPVVDGNWRHAGGGGNSL